MLNALFLRCHFIHFTGRISPVLGWWPTEIVCPNQRRGLWRELFVLLLFISWSCLRDKSHRFLHFNALNIRQVMYKNREENNFRHRDDRPHTLLNSTDFSFYCCFNSSCGLTDVALCAFFTHFEPFVKSSKLVVGFNIQTISLRTFLIYRRCYLFFLIDFFFFFGDSFLHRNGTQ